MAESITRATVSYTPCAPLAALGFYLRQINFFAPIRDQVKIAQKQIVHTPLDKLTDAFERDWTRHTQEVVRGACHRATYLDIQDAVPYLGVRTVDAQHAERQARIERTFVEHIARDCAHT
jgi:hypothetical protein